MHYKDATIRYMKPWYFFAFGIVLFGVAILGLRHNDMTSFDMKTRILKKDAAGEDVQQDIEELKQFTFTHMNASRSLMLKGAYERARTQAQAEADSSIDGSVYENAQAACDREGQQTTENAQCVQEYVQQRLDESGNQVNMPDEREFTYTFHSPVWTTDIPGIAIAGAIISALVGVFLYIKHTLQHLITKNSS